MPEQSSPAAVGARVVEIVFDCDDPERLATFWSALLGIDIKGRVREDQVWFAALLPICPDGPIIGFQHVPEAKIAKNRSHLDLRVRDLDASARQVASLGGRELATHDERGRRWKVMADPEGNEFCITIAS